MSRAVLLQIVLYVICAGVATGVDMLLLYVLTEFWSLHYQASAMCGYFAGMVTNYSLNKRYTFNNTSTAYVHQFAIFSLVAGVGLVLNQGVLFLCVEYLGLWYMYAKVCAVGFVALWSFVGHRTFTFRAG